MAEQNVDESVVRADRWSRTLALLFAAGLFLVASWLTDDPQFNMIVAAFAGVGLRIYVPYHASIRVADPDHKPIQAYEGTGNYHQGAVGGALVVASLFALAVMVLEPDSTRALAAGGGAGLVSFLLLYQLLPS
jgi:Kef-type K+ transport system membrane component KefB